MADECTTHQVTLCEENKLFVKQYQAKVSYQSSIDDAINRIINDLRKIKNGG